jgi:hypothetical protein
VAVWGLWCDEMIVGWMCECVRLGMDYIEDGDPTWYRGFVLLSHFC